MYRSYTLNFIIAFTKKKWVVLTVNLLNALQKLPLAVLTGHHVPRRPLGRDKESCSCVLSSLPIPKRADLTAGSHLRSPLLNLTLLLWYVLLSSSH